MIKAITIIFMINICVNIPSVSAQHKIASSIGNDLVEDAEIFLEDGVSFFTSPFRFSVSDWLLTAGAAGGSYLLMHADQEIKNKIGRLNAETLNGDFWDFPTSYGIIAYANIFSLTTYAVGLFSREDEIRKLGRLLFESISYSGILVMSARIIAGRERPYSGEGPWKWRGPTLDNEIQSFPSGHTTVAFALSTVLAEYFDSIWSRAVFYGTAGLTAYARVLNNQHWFSDVVVGALIGIVSGLHVMTREHERNTGEKNFTGIKITPSLNGISFTCYFD